MSQQLVKKGTNGKHENIMPKSWIEAIKDKYTGRSLLEILQGFNMYFLSYTGNNETTKIQVPMNIRKRGLWVVYENYDGEIIVEWYNEKSIDDEIWKLDSSWKKVPLTSDVKFKIEEEILYVSYDNGISWEELGMLSNTSDIVSDEEDITTIESEDVKILKFKDRDTTKGKGYIILRTEKSIYEQMEQENTIYEVRYNFDLLGNTLNVPSNSTLLFNGGMLLNGEINGVDTTIKAPSVQIFSSVTLSGRFSVQEFDVCWFGVNYNLSNNASYIKSAIDSVPSYSVIKFSKNNICKCTSNVWISKEGITILNANIQGPNAATFDVSANHITFDNCKFYNCSQVIRLYTANNIKITDCYFKSCSYSIIQQAGYVSSNVIVDRCTCEDAVADFVEANCTASAPSKNWTISNNHFLGSRSYPTQKTEERFVGITAVKNVLITNNIVERVAGDAAVHLEDVGSTAIVSNNIFDNIVGTGCIYTMHNNWDTLVIGNTFKNTDNTNYVVWFEGNTNSKKLFVNNLLIGALTPVYWDDSGFNVIKGNTFIGTYGINLEAVYDMDISGNTFRDILSAVGTQRGTSWRGNPKFRLRNNVFEATRASYCVYCPRNSSSGVGHTKDAVIIGNVFDRGIFGHGNTSNLTDVGKVYINDNVLLSGSIDFSGATIGTNNKIFT